MKRATSRCNQILTSTPCAANGNGGIGIYVDAPQTRLESVYLDWNSELTRN